jgi:hypothetical protein
VNEEDHYIEHLNLDCKIEANEEKMEDKSFVVDMVVGNKMEYYLVDNLTLLVNRNVEVEVDDTNCHYFGDNNNLVDVVDIHLDLVEIVVDYNFAYKNMYDNYYNFLCNFILYLKNLLY